MPEPVPVRVGQLFFHRDTRLAKTGHPVVVKSVDASDLNPWFQRGEILFYYGFGGDRRQYVEVRVYHRRLHRNWQLECFDVKNLTLTIDLPGELVKLARSLDMRTAEFVSALLEHALAN